MSADVFPGAVLRQLEEWGYPMGFLRPTPLPDEGFSVVHQTGNMQLPSADGEITWRQTDRGLQNSATFFVNRDGSVRQALGDPLHMAPWANGDVQQPDLGNPRIADAVRAGVNPNLRTLVAIENVAFDIAGTGDAPITPAQEYADAAIIRYFHARAGIPVSRETVIGHYQINGTDRPNCPAVDKSVIDRIVALAGGTQEDPMLEWYGRVRPQLPKNLTIRAGVKTFGRPGDPAPFEADHDIVRPLVGELPDSPGFWVYLGTPGPMRLVRKSEVAAGDISARLVPPGTGSTTDASAARIAAATPRIQSAAEELAAGISALKGEGGTPT